MTIDVGALRRQVQELARAQARLEKQLTTLAIAPRAGYTSIDAGALTVTDDTGAPRVVLGAQSDGSYAVTAVGATPPVAPSAPVLEAQPGAVSITWDGATDDESGWLADWSHVEAHVAGAAGFEATAENQVGTFPSRSGGTIMVARPAGPVWVKLTAVNSSGAVSPASVEATIVVPDVPESGGSDGDVPPQVADLSVRGGVGSLYYRWSPVDNADVVTYKLYVRAGSAPELTDAYRVAEINGTYQPIREARRVNPETSAEEMMPIAPGIDYHAIVLATDADGPSPASAVVIGRAELVNSEDLALNALTTDHLTANDALFIALRAQKITGVEIEGGTLRTDAGANHIYIGPHTSGSQLPVGVIDFNSQYLDYPAHIQADSTGTFWVSSGWDVDPNTENQSHQSGTLSLGGVGPYQDYSDATLSAEYLAIYNNGPSANTTLYPAKGRIVVRAQNDLLLEGENRVEINAPNVLVNGEDLFAPPFGYVDYGGNNFVGTGWRYPTGAASAGSFLRGGVTVQDGGVPHSTDGGLTLIAPWSGLVAPKRGIYNVFAHVAIRAGTAATLGKRGIQILRNGSTTALAETTVYYNGTWGRLVVDSWVLLERYDALQMRYLVDTSGNSGGIDYARVGMKFSQP